jgi:hypothetical protein
MQQGGKGRFVRREHYSWTERSAIAFLADDR